MLTVIKNVWKGMQEDDDNVKNVLYKYVKRRGLFIQIKCGRGGVVGIRRFICSIMFVDFFNYVCEQRCY